MPFTLAFQLSQCLLSAELNNDLINDQLIREGQAKIDNEIASQFALVSDLITIGNLREEYLLEDRVYQEKVNVSRVE